MELLHSIHRCEQTASKLFGEHAKTKVTIRQAILMEALKQAPNASQTQLVEATGIDRSTLSDLVKRIQRRGWAKRVRSKQDARAYQVHLTQEGHTVLQTAKAAASKTEKALAEQFPSLKTWSNGH